MLNFVHHLYVMLEVIREDTVGSDALFSICFLVVNDNWMNGARCTTPVISLCLILNHK